MSDLEAAITAEMRRQGCRRLPVGSPIYDCDTCREHLDVWIDTRDACSVVDGAVRAGWGAAINAAADRLDALFGSEWGRLKEEEGVVLTEDGRYCDGIAVAEDAVRALLSEGGDRD